MVLSKRIEFRATPEENERLRLAAERAGRTPSDLLRVLVRQVDTDTVTTGIPPLTLSEASSTEHTGVAA